MAYSNISTRLSQSVDDRGEWVLMRGLPVSCDAKLGRATLLILLNRTDTGKGVIGDQKISETYSHRRWSDRSNELNAPFP